MQIVSRVFEGEGYRYSFNGKERDTEGMGGSGSTYDYGFRIYNPNIIRFLSTDPLSRNYAYYSTYQFAGNTPIQAIDLDGLEIYYAQSGEKIGTYGTSTEVRVINANALKEARKEFAVYTNSLNTDPTATNEYLGSKLLTEGSVTFADYFTTTPDATKNAPLVRYKKDCDCNCSSKKQMENAGYKVTGAESELNIHTKVIDGINASGQNTNPNNLTENAIGGAISIMTDLKKGKPVMIGVFQTTENGSYTHVKDNWNPITGHFMVINSSKAENGVISFNYLDNAGGKGNLNLNTTNGEISGSVTGREPLTNYQVSEVRKSWQPKKTEK